jgi:hypothetical protein
MEESGIILKRDSDGIIETSNFDVKKVAPSLDKAIKVLDANFI